MQVELKQNQQILAGFEETIQNETELYCSGSILNYSGTFFG
jgi:hypothetical protein